MVFLQFLHPNLTIKDICPKFVKQQRKPITMNDFDNLLAKRELTKWNAEPLWKLKVTDEEYEELRLLLEQRTHVHTTYNPFGCHTRECALFYAE